MDHLLTGALTAHVCCGFVRTIGTGKVMLLHQLSNNRQGLCVLVVKNNKSENREHQLQGDDFRMYRRSEAPHVAQPGRVADRSDAAVH